MSEITVSVTRRSGYTVIPNDLLEPGVISARAYGVYAYLVSRPDGWRCNVRDLMTWFTEGRDALLAAIKELVAAGYMDQIETREGNLVRRRYVIDADRRHRRTSTTSAEVPTDEGVPRTDFQGPESQAPEKAVHKNKELRSTEVRKRESTYVLSRSDTRFPRGRNDSRRPSMRSSARSRRESADADLDPTKAPDVVDEMASDPEPSNWRADTSMGLVAYFWNRLKYDGVGARALMTIPDPVNKRKLAATFTRWKKAGFSADDIRAMIDNYTPDRGMLTRRIPPWLDFLARRNQLAGQRAADQIINDPTSQAYLDYWGITEADLEPLPC